MSGRGNPSPSRGQEAKPEQPTMGREVRTGVPSTALEPVAENGGAMLYSADGSPIMRAKETTGPEVLADKVAIDTHLGVAGASEMLARDGEIVLVAPDGVFAGSSPHSSNLITPVVPSQTSATIQALHNDVAALGPLVQETANSVRALEGELRSLREQLTDLLTAQQTQAELAQTARFEAISAQQQLVNAIDSLRERLEPPYEIRVDPGIAEPAPAVTTPEGTHADHAPLRALPIALSGAFAIVVALAVLLGGIASGTSLSVEVGGAVALLAALAGCVALFVLGTFARQRADTQRTDQAREFAASFPALVARRSSRRQERLREFGRGE